MRVLLCRSPRLGSWLIRLLTWSDWSHSGIVVGGDQVIEATWPRVRITPLAEVLAAHPIYEVVDLPCPDPGAALHAALGQVGKPYDVKALFGFLVHRDWQEEGHWFCSELVAWCAQQGGARWFRPEALRRVVPQHLWMVPPE
jgi:uncharacterized protein YycO